MSRAAHSLLVLGPPVLCLLVCSLLAACGETPGSLGSPSREAAAWSDERGTVAGVPWARLSPAQVAGARRMGVPAAFENARGMRFVYIPGGDFGMGSPAGEAGRAADEHLHDVTLHVGYFLQVAPITHRQLFGDGVGESDPDEPAVLVRHDEARAIAAQLSAEDEVWDYRLPTEAEWERACRAGAGTTWPWGDAARPPEAYAHPWGLADVTSGVRQWCADRYGPLPTWAVGDPLGAPEGREFVVRGGGSTARPCRCAARGSEPPDREAADLGFRLVAPLGYGLGRHGSVSVTFRLTEPGAPAGAKAPAAGYDLRVISMADRLSARTARVEARWARLQDPGSPVTLSMVPGKYYVYAETRRKGALARGIEIKFHVWEDAIEVPVPVPEQDLGRYGSGAATKPQ